MADFRFRWEKQPMSLSNLPTHLERPRLQKPLGRSCRCQGLNLILHRLDPTFVGRAFAAGSVQP